MKKFLIKLPFGVFVVDENLNVLERHFFKTPEEGVKSVLESTVPKEFEGCETLPEKLLPELRTRFRELAGERMNFREYNEFMNRFAIIFSKTKISRLSRRDKLIIQVASAISDLDKILNLMSERLREWYALHYPEFEESDHAKFAQAIAERGRRENFEGFEFSVGMEFEERDADAVKKYAKNLFELYRLREWLNEYLEELVKKEMPNIYALLGHVIAARLLASAGSLEKLAKMPSSTIQLLGAEKALFRYLRSRGKTKPPKHGIIFLSPYIAKAPSGKRGKIARLLAAKLAVAARMDYYTKEDKGEELKRELEERIKEVLKE